MTRPRLQITSQVWMSAPNEFWSKKIIPSDFQGIEENMLDALELKLEQIEKSTSPTHKLSVDLLTPGLNPKLEQKAILFQEYLFDLVASLVPLLSRKFTQTALGFTSSGDAAGFQKHCNRNRIEISPNIELSDIVQLLRDKSSSSFPDCMVFIAARNNVGDPVLQRIMEITTTCENMKQRCAFLFLNCDLSDKVTSGMQERSRRDQYRNSIVPAFYFRNIVYMQRPSLIPIERAALLYDPLNTWRLCIADCDVIGDGPGSLNRFMKQAVFARTANDPTADNPPSFFVAGTFQSQPSREDLDSALSQAEYITTQVEAATAIVKKKPIINDVKSIEKAKKILHDMSISKSVSSGAAVQSSLSLYQAVSFLLRNQDQLARADFVTTKFDAPEQMGVVTLDGMEQSVPTAPVSVEEEVSIANQAAYGEIDPTNPRRGTIDLFNKLQSLLQSVTAGSIVVLQPVWLLTAQQARFLPANLIHEALLQFERQDSGPMQQRVILDKNGLVEQENKLFGITVTRIPIAPEQALGEKVIAVWRDQADVLVLMQRRQSKESFTVEYRLLKVFV